ncbi:MAG: hypothetical protein MUP47_07205 [Phycisphaerae bacterium]|nr:hypothetical protein [Phycisphaerae bacterium]
MPPRTKTIAELRRELRVKERVLGRLVLLRRRLAARLAALDRRIASLHGAARWVGARATGRRAKARRGRGRRKRATGKPLVSYIHATLARAKRGMRAKDVTKAVVKAGYRTYSKDFYGIVAAALRDTSKFKRLKRGIYTLAA